MSSAPVLTVAVAMYQAEDTIQRALTSVMDQHHAGVEVVIVDDASTDRSVDRARAIETHGVPVRIHVLPTNQGAGPGRNQALSLARGQHVLFLDADDQLLPGAIERLHSTLRNGKDIDLLFFGVLEHTRGTDRQITSSKLLHTLNSSKDPVDLYSLPGLLFTPVAPWAKIIRRSFALDKNLEFPGGLHQDLPWSVEALVKAQSVGGIDELIYRYIRPDTGHTATRSMGTRTLVRVDQVRRIRERVTVSDLPEAVQKHLTALVAVHLIWGNRAAYRTLPEEHHEELFIKSSEELSWWFDLAEPGRSVKSEPLMPTSEREFFSRALRSGDNFTWQKALRTFARKNRWQRRFSPSRYRLFKR